jgi:hypothetical protein
LPSAIGDKLEVLDSFSTAVRNQVDMIVRYSKSNPRECLKAADELVEWIIQIAKKMEKW